MPLVVLTLESQHFVWSQRVARDQPLIIALTWSGLHPLLKYWRQTTHCGWPVSINPWYMLFTLGNLSISISPSSSSVTYWNKTIYTIRILENTFSLYENVKLSQSIRHEKMPYVNKSIYANQGTWNSRLTTQIESTSVWKDFFTQTIQSYMHKTLSEVDIHFF